MTPIKGYEAGAKALTKLLREIRASISEAATEGEEAVRGASKAGREKLIDFTHATRAINMLDFEEFQVIKKLDELADSARRDLLLGAMEEIVGRIEDRASELNLLTKELDRQAGELEREALEIKLVPIRETIESLTDVIESFKEAKKALADNDSDQVAVSSKINKLIRSSKELMGAVDNLSK
jgi:hypothetical protein